MTGQARCPAVLLACTILHQDLGRAPQSWLWLPGPQSSLPPGPRTPSDRSWLQEDGSPFMRPQGRCGLLCITPTMGAPQQDGPIITGGPGPRERDHPQSTGGPKSCSALPLHVPGPGLGLSLPEPWSTCLSSGSHVGSHPRGCEG